MKNMKIKLFIAIASVLAGGAVLATTPRYLVRGTEEEPTVVDSATVLEWQQHHSNASSLEWGAALAHCENLTWAGHDDWRLPNVRELMTIVDEKKPEAPAINTVYFSSFDPKSGYWTSTTHRTNDGSAYLIYFNEQNVDVGRGGVVGVIKTSLATVLCVRNSDL